MPLVVDFWFEFASTYSYPAMMRIAPLAQQAGVMVRFRPFLLGPMFKAQGWDTSPFNIYETKGRYMWRDMERLAAGLNLPFRRPDPFPQNSVLPARVAPVRSPVAAICRMDDHLPLRRRHLGLLPRALARRCGGDRAGDGRRGASP